MGAVQVDDEYTTTTRRRRLWTHGKSLLQARSRGLL